MRVPRRLGLAVAVLAVPVALVAMVYLFSPVYRFPPPRPFQGAAWYNPYASLAGAWHKVNLHAHARAWGGLTDGRQDPPEVADAYRSLGFDVAAISDYQRIDGTGAAEERYVPTYECGYSIFKAHRLAIGATAVQWLDFPLGQTAHHKQLVLDRMRPTAALLAIAHPCVRHGHTRDDLQVLGNYDLVEAVNPAGLSLAEWDSALSSGHAVWVLGSDDNHDVARGDLLGVCWTAVNADSRRPDKVIAALRAGRHVGVSGSRGAMDNGVRSVTVVGDTIRVTLDKPANRIIFVGAEGRVLASVDGVAEAACKAAPSDPYVRIEVQSPATIMYLNPIIRWDGHALPAPHPTLDVPATWGLRAAIAAAYAAVGWMAVRLARRRRRSS